LGTEFGVEVDKQGGTTSRVFRGSVRLEVASVGGKAEGIVQLLHKNESARVEANSGSQRGSRRVILLGPSARTPDFVRKLVKLSIKTLDLVDVVAGGNGFAGRRDRGIDPTNGRIVNAMNQASSPLQGDGQYHRVTGMPFVDGVFIPDGGNGAVQVDSAGHVFAGFGRTENSTWQFIWAGGNMLRPPYPTKTWNVDYASPGHGLVFLHANNAITFDLDAIRRANSTHKLIRFCAGAANMQTIADRTALWADAWVLVDGQLRFCQRKMRQWDGVFPVVISIEQKDRFLTLATTDGGDSISGDWIIFGDPRLELLPVATKEQEDADGH
jgi:hypothetical protein